MRKVHLELLITGVIIVGVGCDRPSRPQEAHLEEAAGSDLLAGLERRAQAGDVQAQIELGMAYKEGEGVPKDLATARKWFLEAAGQGSADGQYNLATTYCQLEFIRDTNIAEGSKPKDPCVEGTDTAV